jgi:hypothetical protein
MNLFQLFFGKHSLVIEPNLLPTVVEDSVLKQLRKENSLLIQENHNLRQSNDSYSKSLSKLMITTEQNSARSKQLLKEVSELQLTDTGYNKSTLVGSINYEYRADGRVVARMSGIPVTVHQLIQTIKGLQK